MYQNIWTNQILLSKISNISIDVSDTFSEQQMSMSFTALEKIAKAQDEAIEKEMKKY